MAESMVTRASDVDRSPDPVAEPKAYQELLVGLVEDDDPADVQRDTADSIRALVAEAGADLRVRPEPTEWSVLECVAHMADAELVASGRYRWILAQDEPELVGYDQDRWVDHLHQPPEDAESCSPRSTRSGARTSRFGRGPRPHSAIGRGSTVNGGRRATS